MPFPPALSLSRLLQSAHLLELDPGKAKGFAEMGYNIANKAVLEETLLGTRAAIELSGDFVVTTVTEYGVKKTVEVLVVGPSGKEGFINVVWMLKNGSNIWEIITAIPKPIKDIIIR